jgi:hypothetical protein
MSWFAVTHWQRHGYWSQLAALASPEHSEIVSSSPVESDPSREHNISSGRSVLGPTRCASEFRPRWPLGVDRQRRRLCR